MKKYYYPLIFSGAIALLSIGLPSQASTEKQSQLEQSAIASNQKDTQFLKNVKKISAIAPSSKSAKKLTLSQQGNTFVLKSQSKSSKLEKSPQLLAQNITPPPTAPSSAPMVPQPQITIEENGSSNTTPNVDPTTDFQQPATPAAPVLPRAVAPPVGDIAISNIDAAPDLIDLGTDIVVPRLVLRQAPAREVLAVLARYAGLNLVFTDEQAGGGQGQQGQAAPAGEPTVSLDLENESVQEVFNSVLLVSNLKASRRGRTIFVGSTLPDSSRNLVNRTMRLNQATAENAAAFLSLQGAQVNVYIPQTRKITRDPQTGQSTEEIVAPKIIPLVVDRRTEGASAAIPLNGLLASADTRLNSINLVGEPYQVELATSLLTQLDARRRQVAVNVKVLDVNLSNTENFNTSFSFGINDTFFIQDNGAASLRFGTGSPARNIDIDSGLGRITNPPTISIPRPDAGSIIYDYPRRFLAQLQANVTNGNAKILTDPTLVVQEGQEANVRLVERVLTSVNTQVDPLSGVRTTTPVLEDAGLTLAVNIEKIDDNGFVNLSVNPTIAAPGNTINFDSGDGTLNTLTLLNRRELQSGRIRLRDGQTLILSGIIQESDRTVISKVPILGDIPLLGALFRSTDNIKERAEVVILLTPQIVDDDPRSQFGYNYKPSPAASEMLQERGFNPQEMTEEEQEAKEREQKRREEERERRESERGD